MINKRLCLSILRNGSSPYSASLRALATSLCLFCDDSEVSRQLADEVQQGRLTIDSQLILDSFRRADPPGKIAIATFDLAHLLPPRLFLRLFAEAFGLAKSNPGALVKLARTLRDFLVQHPSQARAFHSVLRTMSRYRNADVQEAYLELAGLTGFSHEADWRRANRWLESRNTLQRLAAIKALYFYYFVRSRRTPSQCLPDRRKKRIEIQLKRLAASDPSYKIRDWSKAIL